MKTTRRSFLTFLGALAPGLALARAGMGGWVAAPAVFQGLDAWLPVIPYAGTPPEFLGIDRGVYTYVIQCWRVDEHGVAHEVDGSNPITVEPAPIVDMRCEDM